jgi:hypothetical protein
LIPAFLAGWIVLGPGWVAFFNQFNGVGDDFLCFLLAMLSEIRGRNLMLAQAADQCLGRHGFNKQGLGAMFNYCLSQPLELSIALRHPLAAKIAGLPRIIRIYGE